MQVRRLRMKGKIVKSIKENPNATAKEIALLLQTDQRHVNKIAKLTGLKLKRKENIIALGKAAQQAGMTIKDIEEWVNDKASKDRTLSVNG